MAGNHITDTDNPRITAILGPTNTGKTHFALERMMGHETGMIGFPLRLLARENYDRVCQIKGAGQVALMTGEEKIVPKGARYFLCTVEAMPVDRAVAFLAIDEIQLCADPDRGHIFTDRLLRARGTRETAFLGAETMRGMIEILVPGCDIVTRPRFSTLTYTGYKKVTRLPRRSAAIAFSTADVYALAELIRRHRGGTAVVLGALSPRTRNAQVALYQAGEVDYLVATDAIGMGLNMDIDHVAFAELGKFDGRVPRNLRAAEIAQIAGRAGRHMNDGTFGTTAEAGLIAPDIVEAVEHHRFDPIQEIMWRNPDLDFRSPDRLLACLDRVSPHPVLRKANMAQDQEVLIGLMQDDAVRQKVRGDAATRLLWDVCQIPDFRKIMSDAHIRLCGQIFDHLSAHRIGAGQGRLPHDWIAAQVSRLDRSEGDIDALMARLAHIRTWTYISHRSEWLENPAYWQEKTRSVEDRLSDLLHERLTQRFIDRRSAVLMRRMDSGVPLLAAIKQNSEVVVEGEFVGELQGFRFVADPAAQLGDGAAVNTAARRALVDEIQNRIQQLEQDEDKNLALTPDGQIIWRDAPIARLTAGSLLHQPHIDILPTELLDGGQRDRVHQRCEKWLKHHIEAILGPVLALARIEAGGGARGIAFQVQEALGAVPREQVQDLIALLDKDQRVALHRAGVRLGPVHVFVPKTAKTHAVNLRAILWSLKHEMALPAPVPPNGRTSIHPEPAVSKSFYAAIGYPVVGPLAIRVDILDRVIGRIHDSAREGRFKLDHAFAELLGCTLDDLMAVLAALGYRRSTPPVPSSDETTDANTPVGQENVSEAVADGQSPVEQQDGEADTTNTEETGAASSGTEATVITEGDAAPATEIMSAKPLAEEIWYRLVRPGLAPQQARRHERRPPHQHPPRQGDKPDHKRDHQTRPPRRSDEANATTHAAPSGHKYPAVRPDHDRKHHDGKKPSRSPARNRDHRGGDQALPHEKLIHSPFAGLKDLVNK